MEMKTEIQDLRSISRYISTSSAIAGMADRGVSTYRLALYTNAYDLRRRRELQKMATKYFNVR